MFIFDFPINDGNSYSKLRYQFIVQIGAPIRSNLGSSTGTASNDTYANIRNKHGQFKALSESEVKRLIKNMSPFNLEVL